MASVVLNAGGATCTSSEPTAHMSLSAIATVAVRVALGAAGLGTTLKPVVAAAGVAMAAGVAVVAGVAA
jgi:hypothetical protein